ncbi:MAG TPA: guanylate kinase [Terriglobales bacterium]|nr:guanylate kinase [Terriglobales bacterium]
MIGQQKPGTVFIISAPSGSGKTTLTNRLLSLVPGLQFSISYTTREPRGSEEHGREYFFVTRGEFAAMRDAGEFLEHAEVFGNCYGTARRFLAEATAKGKDLILDIDVQGAQQVKEKMPEAISIFILPPSRSELEMRLTSRSQAEHVTSREVIRRRLEEAAREIEKYPKYDYILVNDHLEESIDQLKSIVLAERAKRSGSTSPDEKTLAKANALLLPNMRQRAQQIFESFGLAPAPQ